MHLRACRMLFCNGSKTILPAGNIQFDRRITGNCKDAVIDGFTGGGALNRLPASTRHFKLVDTWRHHLCQLTFTAAIGP